MMTAEHQQLLDRAIAALYQRDFWAPYPEHPSPKVYGETADADGKAAYEAMLGKPFTELHVREPYGWVGQELSPYTQEALGITYPALLPETYVFHAGEVSNTWAATSAEQRAEILISALDKVRERFFQIAYATMHTTGQGYMMAFQASGPHAADRALEAVAMAVSELKRFAQEVVWEKPMGKTSVVLRKWWRAVPKGINLVIGCSTFPTWNTVPGMFAGLATGNPVIVKPHPAAILPIAIVVAEVQKALVAAGLPAEICQLAPDTASEPITKILAENPLIRLIDYTGSTTFGDYVESLPGKITFTEKAGVNSVLLESCDDMDAVVANLAFSICLYSGQMCTAPQNFMVPASGVKTPQGNVSPREFAERLSAGITALVDNPKVGHVVLGAIQNPATVHRVNQVKHLPNVELVLESKALTNPEYPNARTASPAVLLTTGDNQAVYGAELFGPIAFVVEVKDAENGLHIVREMCTTHGAISFGAYTTNREFMDTVANTMVAVGVPVSFNLTGGIYLNQHASFSDFHVTGANPAGNASFTNPEFVLRRFSLIGLREPVAPTAG